MPFHLILSVKDYKSATEWRWVLSDPAGAFLADYEVRLNPKDPVYADFEDLPERLNKHHRGIRSVDDVLHSLGEWMEGAILGGLGERLQEYEQSPACLIQVRIPPEAQELLFRPLELAHLQGKTLAERGFRLIYTLDAPAPKAAATKSKTAPEALRFLAVFSLPRDQNPLNLRRERYQLECTLRRVMQTRNAAIDFRFLQYGATRQNLTDALCEDPGWDVIHLSGHGEAGELVLEQADGTTDPITTDELVQLLQPARARLKLLTLSACYSAAADLRAARALIGLDDPTERQATTQAEAAAAIRALPGLAQRLSMDLDCAALAMRYPVQDGFATDLALGLYRFMLEKHQPLPAALGLALAEALKANPQGAELSRITPTLFGPSAADLRLSAPARPPDFVIPEVGLFGFPPEPERFVGRLMPMLRASGALAPGSAQRGVLFYGMAGAGKTACALELAYRHQRERFNGYAWHKAPEEGRDIAGALTRFAQDLETQLPGLELVGLMDDPEEFQRMALPRLKGLLEKSSILLVIDNLEGLLTSDGHWRDSRWGELVDALLDHGGLSRLVLTSRRMPESLAENPRLCIEAIHALSFGESVLLARELPHLQILFETAEGRATLQRILHLTQGHPKLLELADSLAADPAGLAAHLAQAESAAQGRDASLAAFFQKGESAQGQEGFFAALRGWTDGLAAQLSPAARLLFHFLAALEDEDRVQYVIDANWEDFLHRLLGERGDDTAQPSADTQATARLALQAPGPGLEAALGQLAQAGLIEVIRPEMNTSPEGMGALLQTLHAQNPQTAAQIPDLPALAAALPEMQASGTAYRIHPGVAETARLAADPETLRAADWELGDFHRAIFGQGIDTEMKGGGGLVVEGARRAAPYLLRAARWHEASALLESLTHRDPSPAILAFAIPLLRQIVEAARGTELELSAAGLLASVLAQANRHIEAEKLARSCITQFVAQGDYRQASVAAGCLLQVLFHTGRLEAALQTIEEMADYTRRAGLGPWTQLLDESQRLRALNALGRYTEVLETVERLRQRMADLVPQRGENEAANPWNVRETVLDAGRDAALGLEQWETALALNEDIMNYSVQRGANEVVLARRRFNDYGPLLELGRARDARLLLETCRDIEEQAGGIEYLGRIYGALADLEDREGHPQAAIQFAQVALRYSYQVAQPADCSIGHTNLNIYLEHSRAVSQAVLAHCLAAAVIDAQVSSGLLPIDIRNLAHSPLPSAPPPFSDICAEVEKVEGVHFAALFAALPQRFPDGDAAIAAIWQLAWEQKRELGDKQARANALLASLPEAVREAFQSGDSEKVKAVLQDLPSEERQAADAAMQAAAEAMGYDSEESARLQLQQILKDFGPLLQDIAAVARGEEEPRKEIEAVLPNLEEKGWKLAGPVQRIWAGERDAAALTAGLDEQDAALIQRVLELIGEPPKKKPRPRKKPAAAK